MKMELQQKQVVMDRHQKQDECLLRLPCRNVNSAAASSPLLLLFSWKLRKNYAFSFSAFFSRDKLPMITSFIIITTVLSVVHPVASNPFPPSSQGHPFRVGSRSDDRGNSEFYYKNDNIPEDRRADHKNVSMGFSNSFTQAASSLPLLEQQEQPLPKPSRETFKLNRFCEGDVSLERITCRNLRFRSDLPQKEKYFVGILRAQFINVSGNGDIRLYDFQTLFPNLVVLEITQSAYSSASLINLESTRYSNRWESKVSAALKDTNKDKRPNLNKLFGKDAKGERALLSQGDNKRLVTSPQSLIDGSVSSKDAGVAGYFETNDILLSDTPADDADFGNDDEDFQMDDGKTETSYRSKCRLNWPTIKELNLSSNVLISEALPDCFSAIFPNLELIDLSNNYLTSLDKIMDVNKLKLMDISGNPLNCTNLEWVETDKLVKLNHTLCDQPPHANKAKPISEVLHLVKKIREECRVNCSCDIAYIWEQNNVVHAQTVVNCSGRGFYDFPDPAQLPKPVTTLDLRNNSITSMSSFVEGDRYSNVSVMNLYLDDNQISSINILEGSEWFYNFQMFTLQRNNLTEVPVYVLENLLRQNKRLYKIDLSKNKFKCDCSTVSSFKIWLLKYADYIQNVDDVRCSSTKEQIRYLRLEDWCKVDHGTELIDVLDLVSIVLATLIVAVIAKVYYDYWNFRTKGKLPWIVSKM